MSLTIDVAGHAVSLALLTAAAAVLLWLAFAILSLASRTPQPKRGLRAAERNLIAGSVVLLVAWGYSFDAMSLLRGRSAESATPAATAEARGGSCALITTGMTTLQVGTTIGKADEVRNDEATRGPGAETWVYRTTRCSVSFLGGKVESVN